MSTPKKPLSHPVKLTTSSPLVVSPDKKPRRKRREAKSASDLEDTLYLHIRAAGLPLPKREYTFAAPRRFRFDFCWERQMVAVEVEGGIWTRGRHIQPAGFVKDLEKYNIACLLGFRVFRVTSKMVRDGSALALIEQALAQKKTG